MIGARSPRQARQARAAARRGAGRRLAARAPGPAAGMAALAAGAGAVAAALFACYLAQSRTIPVGSDGASQALQAWDMAHGNPLLRGWWVTDVSFYTTELPQYALIELGCGLSAGVIHVAGAMTYTLLVLCAAFLARGRARGAAGLARALVAGGIMLAPQPGAGTQTLVLSPDHTGTAVPVLLIFLLIDRAPRRWHVPVLAGAALAWTAVADAITVFVAIVPLALACALRVLPAVARPGRRRLPGYELALLAAALLAVPAELAATAAIGAAGGWQAHGLRTALAAPGRLPGNARLTGQGLLELFGADVFGAAGSGSAPALAFAAVHLAGAALAAAGVLAAAGRVLPLPARRARRGDPARGGERADLIIPVLLAAIGIDVAAYLLGVQAVNTLSTREIAPVLPFAAVLAGRLLGGPLLAGPAWWRPALGALLACYAAMLGYAAAQPPAPPQYAALAGWLRARHLTAGLGGYHQANIVTLESGGALTLRAVTAVPGGGIAPRAWNASAAWYDPAVSTASFLVLGGPDGPDGTGITAARAVAALGRPARSYRFGGYQILAWPAGENLLARLGRPGCHAGQGNCDGM